MDEIDLGRLRKFTLVVGLFLITYIAVGISVEPDAHIPVFGVPFRVDRPEWLPIGLALASLCGAVRFYYYGLMLAANPYRKRRDLLDGLTVHEDEYHQPGKPIQPRIFASGKEVWMYWGPRKFSISPWHYNQELMEERAMAFDNAFPKFARARSRAQVIIHTSTDEYGEQTSSYSVEVVIPRRCRLAAIFEDLDYSAPV
jgi:hypothetical protein